MEQSRAHLAIDLGAESGRVIVGVVKNDRLQADELHRFEHRPIEMRTGLHWDILAIWREILVGTHAARRWCDRAGFSIASIGVDTWGVDYTFLSQRANLIGLPRSYRDPRWASAFERLTSRIPKRSLFEFTGVQPMSINTLVQLEALRTDDRDMIGPAEHIVLLPDLFHVLLGAKPCNELTIASSTGLLDARTADWCKPLMSKQAMTWGHKFKPCTPPGTKIGQVGDNMAAITGLPARTAIITPAGHDTACAVAAVPATSGANWCYLSSGTWSLMGVELDAPVIDDDSFAAGLTNELGTPRRIGGRPTVRCHKNIAGLWLVQECKRAFESVGTELSYDALTQAASIAPALQTLINVTDPVFLTPGDMPGKIAVYARSSAQPVPTTPGEFVRTCLESLALEYRRTLQQLERITQQAIDVIHVVGGGGKSRLLNQMTADATRRRLLVGPFEGTAAGNILIQSMGLGGDGAVTDLDHLRRIVAASSDIERFDPSNPEPWDHAARRYESLLQN